MSYRRLFVPEVVQTSAIDCGPACLTSLLGGFGLHASYGRLREACQTGVDGTSVDAIEELANRLGLEAEQIVVPADHVALPEAAALPAMAVVRAATGLTHFVIVWRRLGRTLQVMDPATGRRWTPVAQFARELYIHETTVPAEAWREFAQSDDFATPLKARMKAIGLRSAESAKILASALAEPGWRPIATVDAAVRMLESVASMRPSEVYRLLNTAIMRALDPAVNIDQIIPREYWSVQPAGAEAEVVVRGAVLVRVKGRSAVAADLSALPPEVAAAVREKPPQPVAALWRLLRLDGVLGPAMAVIALLTASVGVMLQALLLRALIEGAQGLSNRGQRIGAVAAVLSLLVILLAIDIPAVAALIRTGRRLETRFRLAFLRKLPRIAEHYFHSRPASDMAERSHSVHNIRGLPVLAGQILRSVFELTLTTAGVIWIDPALWPLATLSAVFAVGLPIAIQPLLGERELRVRTHAGALSHFYLDALLGLMPIRAHVADGAVRGEHRSLLAKWVAANMATQRITIAAEGLQLAVGFGLAAWLTMNHIARNPESSGLLLLTYWALNIPVIGKELASRAFQYPLHRNVVLRLLEPLGALENQKESPAASSVGGDSTGGVVIAMDAVSVSAGGRTVLHDLNLQIPAGSQVAVIGASGAGKSSLVGLLLGWRTPAAGALLVDGEPLSEVGLARLRRQTAWIDPTVHLWNRSLAENLRYGAGGELAMSPGQVVDEAELASVLEKLPDGLQTGLGDAGALLSGGEGERVRIGRALMRPGVRLVIMDEPFRGLDAGARKRLLERTRERWRSATMLFVTHDVADTQSFDRVLVMEDGAIAESGEPKELAKVPGSRYAALLRGEVDLKQRLHGPEWRQLRMEQGALSETTSTPASPAAPGRERIA